MNIVLYTKPSCQSCVIIKKHLTENNIMHTEYVIGADITRDALLAKFPLARVVPIVIVNDEFIGSKEELLRILAAEAA